MAGQEGRSLTRRIHLLRHAMPATDPAVSLSQWSLSAHGRAAAIELSGRAPAGARLLSSEERKAIETARLVGGRDPECDPRFDEIRRPEEPFDKHARARRAAWVRGEPDGRHAGWEAPREAAGRMASAVRDHPDDELLIGTHGLVMVAWLIAIGHVDEGVAAERFWSGHSFPEILTVEIPR